MTALRHLYLSYTTPEHLHSHPGQMQWVCTRDMCLDCLGSHRVKSAYNWSCERARLALEEATVQVVLILPSPEVPRAFLNISEWRLSTHTSITQCHSLWGSSEPTAQGCPPQKLHGEGKRRHSSFPAPWSLQARGPHGLLVKQNSFLDSPSPPSRQITELPRGKQNTASCATLWGKVPSLGNQFAAQSTRFTTCFMSILHKCRSYLSKILRPFKAKAWFDLKVTCFFFFFKSIYYRNNLFLRASQSQLAF